MKIFNIRHPFFFLIVVACSTVAQDDVENEGDFSYDVNSRTGPAHWGIIRSEWKTCNSGKMQSPINLDDRTAQNGFNLGALVTYYYPSNATLINLGHVVMLKWPGGAGHIQINGTMYQLHQLHWHTPSEHTVNGRRFGMEVHIVHQSKDNRTAVIGILYDIGGADPLLSAIKHDLELIADAKGEKEKVVGIIDPQLQNFGTKNYYRYIGSFTTPPCTENVIWSVSRKVRTVSPDQVQLIRAAIHDDLKSNARPVQPLNGRPVYIL